MIRIVIFMRAPMIRFGRTHPDTACHAQHRDGLDDFVDHVIPRSQRRRLFRAAS
jgi:hypothetical protein